MYGKGDAIYYMVPLTSDRWHTIFYLWYGLSDNDKCHVSYDMWHTTCNQLTQPIFKIHPIANTPPPSHTHPYITLMTLMILLLTGFYLFEDIPNLKWFQNPMINWKKSYNHLSWWIANGGFCLVGGSIVEGLLPMGLWPMTNGASLNCTNGGNKLSKFSHPSFNCLWCEGF